MADFPNSLYRYNFLPKYQPIVLPPFILSLIVIVANSNKLTVIVASS